MSPFAAGEHISSTTLASAARSITGIGGGGLFFVWSSSAGSCASAAAIRNAVVRIIRNSCQKKAGPTATAARERSLGPGMEALDVVRQAILAALVFPGGAARAAPFEPAPACVAPP